MMSFSHPMARAARFSWSRALYSRFLSGHYDSMQWVRDVVFANRAGGGDKACEMEKGKKKKTGLQVKGEGAAYIFNVS